MIVRNRENYDKLLNKSSVLPLKIRDFYEIKNKFIELLGEMVIKKHKLGASWT